MVRVRATSKRNPLIQFTMLVEGNRIYDVDSDFAVLGTEEAYADQLVNMTQDLVRLGFALEVVGLN